MRRSGILMHITSLPGPWGVGTMGKQAFAFVDFLKAAGQQCWQVLPLTPTGYGDSPYQSCSTYAGNPYLIDLELLVEEGLLKTEELEAVTWCQKDTKADFGRLYDNRFKVLRKAFARFRDEDEAFAKFRAENDSWLPDFALFMALKERNKGKPWYQWEDGLKFRDPQVISRVFVELEEDVRFYCFVQFLFRKQWDALHSYAAKNGVSVIGDVPIYVPLDSVEVWSQPELFQLDEELKPKAVAGCPPDAFSEDGQLWGNPIYDWDRMAEDGYRWWLRRLAAAGDWYDVVRVDHFRGLEAYWAIPYGDTDARGGRWVKGPGTAFIEAVKQGLPGLRMIAEDLGFLTQEVLDLRDLSGYPGMKVLQFAFEGGAANEYLPYNHVKNSVVYTGTHDNDTLQGWKDSISDELKEHVMDFIGLEDEKGWNTALIRMALMSSCDTAIIPMQDYLELGTEARINEPSTTGMNWRWRLKKDWLEENPKLAKKIKHMTEMYNR